jgi:hypothetical protein
VVLADGAPGVCCYLRRETRRAVRRPVRRATLRDPNISFLLVVVDTGQGGQLAAADRAARRGARLDNDLLAQGNRLRRMDWAIRIPTSVSTLSAPTPPIVRTVLWSLPEDGGAGAYWRCSAVSSAEIRAG